MIVGNRRSIRSENLFGRKKSEKGDQIKVNTFFLEITMILGEKREMRDQSPFLFKEHQVLEILASGP